MHSYISNYMEENNILSPTQFGFRKGRGTANAVFTVLKDLFSARDDKLITAACFIDYRKAFHCVDHVTLIRKIDALNNMIVKRWLTA